MKYQELNTKAKNIASRYKSCEKELLQVISTVDLKKAYLHWGYNSLFAYITKGLGLSAGVASNFSTVARKSFEVPELKNHVLQGKISIHQARRVTSVITAENKNEWLEKASTQSQKQLEREVSLVNPKLAVRESANYVSASLEVKENVKILQKVPRIQLEVGVSEKTMIKFLRAQNLESQRRRGNASLEDTLDALLDTYPRKNDPVEKAKRHEIRGKLKNTDAHDRKNSRAQASKPKVDKSISLTESDNTADTGVSRRKASRKAIPAKIRHQVHLRDGGKCCYIDRKGQRCSSGRYLETHHIKEVSRGGQNTLENLTTLCSGHHAAQHL